MNEKLLQFLWQFKLIPFNNLTTDLGENIEIIDPGQLNTNAGPDFFNAKLKINKTVWAGNIEMHLKASSWEKHKHHKDKAYNNVILHVVLENDGETFSQSGERIATVELKIPDRIRQNMEQMYSNSTWLKCSDSIQKIDPFFISQHIDSLAIDRLEYKQKQVEDLFHMSKQNWEQTCYMQLARNFGFNINSGPFAQLAQKVPHKMLLQYGDRLETMEALLLGAAGFLDEMLNEDEYYQKLAVLFRHLQHKHNILPLEKHMWKFAKTRPTNFPTIRITQFAKLFFQYKNIFSNILESTTIKEVKQLFETSASTYWNTHYRFNAPSKNRVKKLGENAINGIIINSVVPLLFCYGKLRNNSLLCERALVFLENLKAESNSKIRDWAKYNIHPKNARDTQALLHLRTFLCDQKKCLQCKIGLKVLTVNP